tara:strand:- start:184 stop:573 length:390 start_codon:yes stop_codon:yes gene_type:complete
MTRVFTNGCFDVLHRGHIELLKFCKNYGYVIVGLNSDLSVERLKGLDRPIISQQDRKFMLESCMYVDEVIIFEEDTPYDLIKSIKPDIIVKGGDYKKENVVGNDIAEVLIFDYIHEYSTTKIIKNIANR